MTCEGGKPVLPVLPPSPFNNHLFALRQPRPINILHSFNLKAMHIVSIRVYICCKVDGNESNTSVTETVRGLWGRAPIRVPAHHTELPPASTWHEFRYRLHRHSHLNLKLSATLPLVDKKIPPLWLSP